MVLNIRNSYGGGHADIRSEVRLPFPSTYGIASGCITTSRSKSARTDRGLLIQKRTAVAHPVDRIVGILDGADFDIDEYIEEIRGR